MFTTKFNGTDVNFNSHYFFKNQVTIRAQIQETQRRVEQERREQEEARQRYVPGTIDKCAVADVVAAAKFAPI